MPLSDGAGGPITTPLPLSAFEHENARQSLLEHFGAVTLEPFGCANLPLAIKAAGAIIEYLTQTQRGSLRELDSLNTYSTRLIYDPGLPDPAEFGAFPGVVGWGSPGLSLFSTVDLTRTPMGGRLLRRWLGQPLLDISELIRRQDAVGFFHSNLMRRENTLALLSRITDLERVLNRIRTGVASPRELLGLKSSLEGGLGPP